MKRIFSVLLSCIISWQTLANTQDIGTNKSTNTDPTLSQLVQKLPTTKLNKMAPLVKKIAHTDNEKKRNILQFMMEGDLYYIRANKTVVRALKIENSLYALTDVLTAQVLTPVKKSTLRKIKTNNRLRGNIRSFIAKIDLTNKDKNVRIKAVSQLLDNPTQASLLAIQELISQEQDDAVRELMSITLLLNQLKTGDHAQIMAAITKLKDTLEPSVNNTMVKMLAALPTENKTAQQKELALSLTKVISNIEDKRSFFGVVENIFFGLSLGSVLLLAAIGLTITFGV
ncbi:MAG: urea transport system permease protein, partial [Cognaticolwellia sp.]